ncbi:MAG: hypothetical protein JWO58_1241 [Chitinophagaceae bacterium]|nr:hypothetical protein [Chitinophagaceae bacterium]
MKSTYNLSLPLSFLKKIKKNNDRTWFAEHKGDYEKAFGEMILFSDAVLAELKKHDDIETPTGKRSLYRIYNDVRFSKDKSPYKLNLGAGFRRATAWRRGGYYLHIQPGSSFVAGGFWGPNTQDLNHIRQQIAADLDPLTHIVKSKPFKKVFGEIRGEQVKTAPRGYTADHPAIDFLRFKQFILKIEFSDEEVLHPNFHKKVADSFQHMRPFLDYMSEILTTDLNGIRIVE